MSVCLWEGNIFSFSQHCGVVMEVGMKYGFRNDDLLSRLHNKPLPELKPENNRIRKAGEINNEQ